MANMFSLETRKAAMAEVAMNHARMLELDERRKQLAKEYNDLDTEARQLHQAIEDACDVMGIDFKLDKDEDGNDKKVFYLTEEEPSE
jgi:hypothetical protein